MIRVSTAEALEPPKALDPSIVLNLLQDVMKSENGWEARCPAHDDNRQSLSISIGDNGKMLYYCHAGCSVDSIWKKLGIPYIQFTAPGSMLARSKARKSLGKVLASYDYYDESGKLIYQVRRHEPKDFRQYHATDDGKLKAGLNGCRRVLYRFPELLAAPPTETVFIVEGEKDCDNLRSLGLIATTNSGGAEKWLDDFNAHFKSRNVVILPDNDEPGRKHAAKIASRIQAIAASVRIVQIPNLPAKGDVSDWIAAGGTKEQLLELVEQCEIHQPSTKEIKPNEEDDDPHRLARCIIENCFTHPDHPKLVLYREEFYAWHKSAWSHIPNQDLNAKISTAVKEEFDRLNVAEQRLSNGSDETPTAKKVTRRLCADVMNALAGEVLIPSAIEAPAWLDFSEPPFPLRECIFAQNAVVHLPSFVSQKQSHRFEPTPSVFTTAAIGCDFNPNAPRPDHWFSFLDSIWGGDEEAKLTLQQWFGYCLANDTRHQKILLIVGPKRSGKGTIARIMTALLGKSNVAGPTLSSLGTNFGLANLVGKPLAIISDARLSGRTDVATITERLLSISGEDGIDIDRKYLSVIKTRLPTRFMIMTNELPRLNDASGALASRFVVLTMTQSWIGKEDKDLEKKLIAELPSILLWAIAGWHDLKARGRFIEPASSQQSVEELEDLGSPVAAFIRDCCMVGPKFSTPVKDLYQAWKDWCKEHGRENTGDEQKFGRDLRSVIPILRTARPRISGGHRHRIYEGVGLGQTKDY